MDQPTPPSPAPSDRPESLAARPMRPAAPPDPRVYAATAPPRESGRRAVARLHRDPGGTASRVVTWSALALLLVITVALQWGVVGEPDSALESTLAGVVEEPPAPGGFMLLLGRYAVGADQIAKGSGAQVLGQLETLAAGPVDRLRLAMVAGEVAGAGEALAELGRVSQRAADGEEDEGGDEAEQEEEAPLAPWLLEDRDALVRLYSVGTDALSEGERLGLVERHGWFGRLAIGFERPDTDAMRHEALGSAKRAVMVIFGAVGLGGGAFLIGVALAILAIVLRARGGLRARYAPPAPGGSAYLEAFTIFLAGFLALSVVAGVIEMSTGADVSWAGVWLLPLCALWPRLRGADWASMRYALGWHRGAGVWREVGAGALGYLAGLPIFAAGILLTLLVALVSETIAGGEQAPPSHPVFEKLGQGGVWGAVAIYLLAAVWAPLTEETMFRGALQHHLRGKLGAVSAALLVGLVFAAIHPQGLVAVPALMSLGVVFSLIREWRGSIIGSMTAHALHNGTLVTILLLAMS